MTSQEVNWKSNGVRIIPGDSLDQNTPQSPGMTRAASSGVYGLCSTIWIYVGEADNIRACLLEHLACDNPSINDYEPFGFAFELVSPPDRPRRLEELLMELQPLCMRRASSRRAAS